VDILRKAFRNDVDVGIVSYYCQANQRETRSVDEVLKNILSQLLAGCVSIPETVIEQYASSLSGQSWLEKSQCEALLRDVFKCFRRCFIVIDALDEFVMETKGVRQNGLTMIKDLYDNLKLFSSENPNCHVLLSSRNNCTNDKITENLLQPIYIEVKASKEDLQSYFQEELVQLKDILDYEESEHSRVTQELIDKTQGQ
jgi:hypothetical protein